MAKKKAKSTKQNETTKPVEKSTVEKKEQNYKVIIGLLLLGIGVLLFLLYQNQQTIAEQRAKISNQQNEIKTLEAKIEKFENEPVKTILEGAGEQLLEKGTEILEEILTPEDINL